ncbi:unnamed protein product [Alopecurus aequalis]
MTMGANAEGYKPGHYAVGNLQAGANGWWSSYEEEKTSNRELYNGFMPTEAVSYSDYDKEGFKRTMLAHEATFRQQVHELHRVYGIQRDLVEQYQNKEMLACPRLEDASQTNSPSQLGADNYFEDGNALDNKPIDFLGLSSDAKPTGPSYPQANSWQQSVWGSSTTNNRFNKEYSKDKRFNEGTSSNFIDTSYRNKQEEKPLIDKGEHASNGTFLAPRYSETDPQKIFNVADAISSDLEQNDRLMFEHTAARHGHKDPDFANGNGRNNFNLNEALSDDQEDVLVEQEGLEEPRKVFEHSYETVMETKINKERSGAALALCNLPDSASTSAGCGAKKDRTQESAACLPTPCQKHVPKDVQAAEDVIIRKSGAVIVNLFDLNDDVPEEDNSESSIVSHECHVTSLQNNHAKRAFVIDLEMPACEDAAATVAADDSVQKNHAKCAFAIDLEMPACEDANATAASEDILALSVDVLATDEPHSMLQWFAELAVSGMDDHARQVEVQGCIGNSSDDDDLDSFESLTPKLEETKTVGLCSRPLAPAITNDEQTVSAVNLLTKPKRGKQTKRRQKRDFQKDILPSISSLRRPEIIEDIQLLEGLVQTSGGSWESSFTRRQRTRGKKPKERLPDTLK